MRERAVMKKFLVIALIEGADIDNDDPGNLGVELRDLLENDFADSAEVTVADVETAVLHTMFNRIGLKDKFFL